MIMKSIILANLLTTLLLTSCSPAPEQTKTKISFGASYAEDNFPGGLYILARNIQEDKVSMRRIQQANHELFLDNGDWEFAAIGWEGSAALTGNTKCFKSSQYELNGKDTDINFTLNDVGCSEGDLFTPDEYSSGSPKKPNQISVISCAFLESKDSKDIEENYFCEDTPGLDKSFRILLYDVPFTTENERDAKKMNPFHSECVTFDNLNHNVSSTVQLSIPAFKSFPMTVQTFAETGCSGEKATHHFPKGIRNSELSFDSTSADGNSDFNPLAFTHPGDGTRTKIFVKSEICSRSGFSSKTLAQQGTDHGLNGGTAPYYICNETQFGGINNNPSATVIIANNIDFNNDGNNIITSNFSGEIKGNYKTLKNLSLATTGSGYKGLFSIIDSGALVENINLQNFNISVAGTASIGLLAGKIYSGGAKTTISGITIDSTSAITSTTGKIGGLSGYVYADGSSGSIDISNVHSEASVSQTSNTALPVGGLFGKTDNNSTSGSIIIHESSVSGITVNQSSSSVTSSSGGIVGTSIRSHFLKANVYGNSIIQGPIHIGGIIGNSTQDLISQSRVEVEIKINSDGLSHFGGAIGKAALYDSDSFTAIIDSVIKSNFSALNTGEAANKIGGVIGATDFPSSRTNVGFLVRNNKVNFESYINGNDHGGLIGLESNVKFGTGNNDLFLNNIVRAKIHEETQLFDTTNSYRGGLFGSLQGGSVKRNIIVSDLRGTGPIGGLAGAVLYNSGAPNTAIDENYIHTRIHTYNDSSDIRVGGAVGLFQDGPTLKNIKVDGFIFIEEDGTNCSGTGAYNDFCGRLIGQNLNGTWGAISNIVLNNKLLVDSDANDFLTYGIDSELGNSHIVTGGSLSGGNIFQDHNLGTVANLSAIGSGPWDGSWSGASSVSLTFYNKHLAIGALHNQYDLDGEITGDFGLEAPDFQAGNKLEPFNIYNKEDWNKVSDDSYLLSKSYMLQDNISFNHNKDDFNPFGGFGALTADKRFTGKLFSNGFEISDIKMVSSDFDDSEDIGIFRGLGAANIESGEIGDFYSPLFVRNIHIDINDAQAANIGTIAGSVEDGKIWARVTNAKIETTGPGTVVTAGGLVGSVSNGAELDIYNSLFEGRIENNGSALNVAGGLIGEIAAVAGNKTQLINNAVITSHISGDGSYEVGGFIGNATAPAGSQLTVYSNYVYFSGNSAVLSGGIDIGGFIGKLGSGGTINIHNNFVDLANLAAPPSSDVTEMFSQDGSSSGGLIKNFVIKGSYSNAGNSNMVEASYEDYAAVWVAAEAGDGLLGPDRDNGFYFDIGNPDDLSDDRVKLYWEYGL
jgi:hypothetical protein